MADFRKKIANAKKRDVESQTSENSGPLISKRNDRSVDTQAAEAEVSAAAIESAPTAESAAIKPVKPPVRDPAPDDGDATLGVQRVFRSGLKMEDYGKTSKAHQIFIYNKHVNRYLKNFSDDNKDLGGEPIIKNALVEAILDVVIYDMNLKPQGFKHVEEIREFLRSKLK